MPRTGRRAGSRIGALPRRERRRCAVRGETTRVAAVLLSLQSAVGAALAVCAVAVHACLRPTLDVLMFAFRNITCRYTQPQPDGGLIDLVFV
jgi:hypothetical protein